MTGISLSKLPEDVPSNPDTEFFSEKMWNSLLHLSTLECYTGLDNKIAESPEKWKDLIKSLNLNELPEPYN